MSENSSELDMFETGRRSPAGDEIERIRAETARINAEAEKIKAENERQAAQSAAARSKSLEEEELTKWEYTRADVRKIQELNELGDKGWKLVTCSDGTGVLMRKKQQPKQNQSNDYGRSY